MLRAQVLSAAVRSHQLPERKPANRYSARDPPPPGRGPEATRLEKERAALEDQYKQRFNFAVRAWEAKTDSLRNDLAEVRTADSPRRDCESGSLVGCPEQPKMHHP